MRLRGEHYEQATKYFEPVDASALPGVIPNQ